MLKRIEEPDLIYRTEREKFEAIVNDIIEKQASGRPTLVGTVSIEKSERLSSLLKKRGIKHVVLNAKYHAQEAEIVAQAGHKNNVTIATNMAGRGTDILLGGNPEYAARHQCLAEEVAEKLAKGEEKFVDDEEFVYFFHVDSFYRVPRPDWERIFSHFKRQMEAEHDEVVAIGGLHILGTERHEARRIDNQLRGRAGRQGDPGSSRFYLSLEDDLMRIFGSDRISGLMQRLGMEEGVPIEHGMVSRAIERAQKQVEAQNFGVRKHLLEYDDVMNKQRESVYTLRREVLEGSIHLSEEEIVNSRDYLMALAEEILEDIVERYAGKQADVEEFDIPAVVREVSRVFGIDPRELEALQLDSKDTDEITDAVWASPRKATFERNNPSGRTPEAARARHHAADRRCAVEGPPLLARSSEGRHRPSRLRAARSTGRVQERELRALPGHEGAHRRRDRAISVLAASGHDGRSRRAGRATCCPAGSAGSPPRRPAASTMTLNHPGASSVPAFAGAARSNQAAAAAPDADAGKNWRR